MRTAVPLKREAESERSPEPRPASTKASSSPALVLALLVLVVAGVTLFAHWPVLSAQALFFDDEEYMTENSLVQHPSWTSAGRFLREVLAPSTVQGYYQPLTMISLMVDYSVAGRPDNLRPFHWTSLGLHIANTMLVAIFIYLVFGQPWVAAMVGLLFGVHPMTVEPIPWVSERKTLLATFFALSTLVVYIRHARRPNWKPYLTCLVLYILALMSKPTSTTLPFVLLLLDFWPLGRLNKRAILEKLPFLAIGVAAGVITTISQAYWGGVHPPNEYPASRIPLILCHNIVFYPYKIVWPARLWPCYAFPVPPTLSNPAFLAGVIGTCVLIPALLVSLRWTRALLTGWLIFFTAIFPTMGVLGFTMVIAADKYAYLPAVGLLLIAGWLLERIWSISGAAGGAMYRVGVVGVVAAIACLLMIGTRRQLSHWQTTLGILDYTVALAPNVPELYSDRGNAYVRTGDYDRAIDDLSKAITLNPGLDVAHYNRGVAYSGKGDGDQAIRDFTTALKVKPDYAEAYYARGAVYAENGDGDQAIHDYTRAIELKRSFAKAYNNRGAAYADRHADDQAMNDYTKAIESSPDFAPAYYNRARLLDNQGAYDQAVRDYTKAIELKPNEARIYIRRGATYARKGDYDQALRDGAKAIELAPNNAIAYGNRAQVYLALKEYDKSWADVKACRQLGGTPSPEVVQKLTEATGRSE